MRENFPRCGALDGIAVAQSLVGYIFLRREFDDDKKISFSLSLLDTSSLSLVAQLFRFSRLFSFTILLGFASDGVFRLHLFATPPNTTIL